MQKKSISCDYCISGLNHRSKSSIPELQRRRISRLILVLRQWKLIFRAQPTKTKGDIDPGMIAFSIIDRGSLDRRRLPPKVPESHSSFPSCTYVCNTLYFLSPALFAIGILSYRKSTFGSAFTFFLLLLLCVAAGNESEGKL